MKTVACPPLPNPDTSALFSHHIKRDQLLAPTLRPGGSPLSSVLICLLHFPLDWRTQCATENPEATVQHPSECVCVCSCGADVPCWALSHLLSSEAPQSARPRLSLKDHRREGCHLEDTHTHAKHTHMDVKLTSAHVDGCPRAHTHTSHARSHTRN